MNHLAAMFQTVAGPSGGTVSVTQDEAEAVVAALNGEAPEPMPDTPHPADPRVAVAMEVLRIGAQNQHNITGDCRDAACEVLIAALYQRPIAPRTSA